MKFIVKGQEPTTFRDWKAEANENWTPCYDNLQAPQKPILHQSLLQEQGFICCYCNNRIEVQDSHIEHLVPQSQNIQGSDVDYNNMLASCGRSGASVYQGHSERTCGEHKGESTIPITPEQHDCELKFSYGSNGSISSATPNDNDAQQTIRILNLDCDKLNRNRKDAIDGIIFVDRQTGELISDAERIIILQRILDQDIEGRFIANCITIKQVLEGLA